MERDQIRSFSGPYFPVFGLRKSPYSVQMRENTDQKNSAFGQFLRSPGFLKSLNQTTVLVIDILICGTLRVLVPFVQFKKREKHHSWESVTFSKVAGFSISFYAEMAKLYSV